MKIPYGLACCSCIRAHNDCSGILFDNIKKVVKTHKDGVQEVVCPDMKEMKKMKWLVVCQSSFNDVEEYVYDGFDDIWDAVRLADDLNEEARQDACLIDNWYTVKENVKHA